MNTSQLIVVGMIGDRVAALEDKRAAIELTVLLKMLLEEGDTGAEAALLAKAAEKAAKPPTRHEQGLAAKEDDE